MNKRYRLGEIEEAVSEMEELIDTQDDIAEVADDFQIVVSGWSVYVESLNLTLRQGVACIWDTEAGLFMPDFDVTIVYMRETSKHRNGSTMSRTEWLLHLATG